MAVYTQYQTLYDPPCQTKKGKEFSPFLSCEVDGWAMLVLCLLCSMYTDNDMGSAIQVSVEEFPEDTAAVRGHYALKNILASYRTVRRRRKRRRRRRRLWLWWRRGRRKKDGNRL